MFRFSNGITYNNKDFKRFGYKETDECSFCKEEAQTSKHLFWECPESRKLWEGINNNLKEKGIGEREVFLGENEDEDRNRRTAKNSLLAFTLQYIYKSNYKTEKLSTVGLMESIKYIRRVEKEIAERRNNVLTHLIKWENIEDLFKDDCIIISERNPDLIEQERGDKNKGKDSMKTWRKGRKRSRGDETEQKEVEAIKKRRRK